MVETMKCILFLVLSEVIDGTVKYSMDATYELDSYLHVDKQTNVYDYYTKRSNLIGKDHEWSKTMEESIKKDAEIYSLLDLRMRINDRLTMHCVKTNNHDFGIDELHVLFDDKIETATIVDFLKDSKI